MSYISVIKHIQKILNDCGDGVSLYPTGAITNSEWPGHLSIEIKEVRIQKHNRNFLVPPPLPMCQKDNDDHYTINRIRISSSMIDDYSKNYPYSNEDIVGLISGKTFLFGWYP